jgi:glutathione S-transferase
MELWSAPTPNGWKVSIMLEELAEAGVDISGVRIRTVNIGKGEQFTEDFTARNPIQKIPVLRDGDRDIHESCAILQYLAEKYPTSLLPGNERVRARPGTTRGIAYGVPKDEVDSFSADRRASYKQGGANMAANENIKKTV